MLMKIVFCLYFLIQSGWFMNMFKLSSFLSRFSLFVKVALTRKDFQFDQLYHIRSHK